MQKNRIFHSLLMAAIFFFIFGNSGWAAIYSGAVGNFTDANGTFNDVGGMSATGNAWAGTGNSKINKGVHLDWTVDKAGNNWVYTYIFTINSGAYKDIEHFDLQVAPDFGQADLVSWTAVAPLNPLQPQGPLSGNTTPADFGENSGPLSATQPGIILHNGFQWSFPGTAASQPEYSFGIQIVTGRAPMWGDFLVSSSEVTASDYISAYNSDFGTTKGAFPTTAGVYNGHVAVPGPAPVPFNLTVAVSGTNGGGGSVTSDPAGIACTAGNSCSAPFSPGDAVTLSATPDGNSIFGQWSGACTGPAANCAVTMDGDKSVTATFTYVQPVQIPGTVPVYYSKIQDAYNALSGSGTILARQFNLVENLNLGNQTSAVLKGGYNTAYTVNTGSYTSIQGSVVITQGSLTVENIIIQ